MDIKALLSSNRLRRFRKQHGTVIQRSDAWYLRYYRDDTSGQRVKVTEKLCDLDAKGTTREQLRRRRMAAVNDEGQHEVRKPAPELTVAQFWDSIYLPWARAELRHSTVYGYEKLWEQVLRTAIGDRALVSYTAADAYQYLLSVRSRFNRNSLSHVRALASGIFQQAVNLGKIPTNPWRQLKPPKTPKPKDTHAYSLEESYAILNALSTRVDAALVFSLAAFLGLRPSEIAGLQWSDVTENELHVRRAVVRGIEGETKTEQSQGSLVLIEPVRSLLAAWREQCGGVTAGWLFTGRSGRPMKMESFVKHAIMEPVREAGLEWHGLYAARRACATNLTMLTGNVNAAHQVLRNSLKVVMEKYSKPTTAAGMAGLKALEEANQKLLEAATGRAERSQ